MHGSRFANVDFLTDEQLHSIVRMILPPGSMLTPSLTKLHKNVFNVRLNTNSNCENNLKTIRDNETIFYSWKSAGYSTTKCTSKRLTICLGCPSYDSWFIHRSGKHCETIKFDFIGWNGISNECSDRNIKIFIICKTKILMNIKYWISFRSAVFVFSYSMR